MSLSHAESRKIAARYVEAFFDLAKKAKKEAQVAEDFAALSEVYSESEILRKAIKNPLVSAQEKYGVFTELLLKAGGDKTTGEFLQFLAEKKRLDILPELADMFTDKLAEHKGELMAVVTTAKKLKAPQVKAIEKALKDAAGKPVSVTVKEDASLMGGIMIRLGSKLLDHSVAGKLSRLAVALKQPTMAN